MAALMLAKLRRVRVVCNFRAFGALLMRTPSLGSILLALVPFAAMCFSVSLWDRIDPVVAGLPFNLFWLVSWIVLTPLFMWGAYRLEARRQTDASQSDQTDNLP